MTVESNPFDPDPADDPPLDFNERRSRPLKSLRQNPLDSQRAQHLRTSSRAVTIRLVFLVVLLAMVIWGMRISGKAESWRWLIRDQGPNAGTHSQSSDSDHIDSSQIAAATIQIPSNDAPGTDDPATSESGNIPDLVSSLHPESVSNYEREFVRRFLKSLNGHESCTFWQLVQNVAGQNELSVVETATSTFLVNRLASQWDLWNRKWDSMFEEGSVAPERRSAILKTRERWESTVLPALASITIHPEASLNQEQLLDFRLIVKQAGDLLVEQYTQPGRPVESYAWFSAWSDVFNQPVAMERGDLPAPSITQLLGQPEAWVGQLIAVEGTALRVVRVAAGKNPFDINEYFVVWIRPNHPSMYPFCVYALILPEPLSLADGLIERDLLEPIAVAGRFFKVRLFDGGGKAGQAPLLMAATVEVQADAHEANGSQSMRFPGAGTTLTTLLLIGLVACSVAWLVWRSSQGGKLRGQPTGPRMHSAMDNLANDDRIETVRQKIERLEKGGHE